MTRDVNPYIDQSSANIRPIFFDSGTLEIVKTIEAQRATTQRMRPLAPAGVAYTGRYAQTKRHRKVERNRVQRMQGLRAIGRATHKYMFSGWG